MSFEYIVRVVVAEAAGTFVLVFGVVGAALLGAAPDAQTSGGAAAALGVALTLGLSVSVAGVAFGGISGGHFNPAVTLALTLSGRAPWRLAPFTVAAQVLGGLAATASLALVLAGGEQDLLVHARASGFASAGWRQLSPGGFSLSAAFLTEAIATAVLSGVVVALSMNQASGLVASLSVGATLAVLAFIAIPVSNASLNPARAIATAAFGGPVALSQMWLPIIAPLMGAGAVGAVSRLLARPSRRRSTWRAATYVMDAFPVPAVRRSAE